MNIPCRYLFPFIALLLQLSLPAFAAPAPAPGKFLRLPAIKAGDAKVKCPVDPQSENAKSDWPCKVLRYAELGTVGDTELRCGWYQRTGTTSKGIRVESEQLVLFETSSPGELRPVWTDVIEVFGEKEAVTEVKLIHSPLGDFLDIKYFSGGTAGAWNEYFRREGGRWTYLQQDLDGDAAKCLPKDYGIQAKEVDFAAGKVRVFTPTDNDPSCCPSGEIELTLSVSGDRLLGRNCQFKKK